MGKGPDSPPPSVSIVLVVYDMPDQARNTLLSLTSEYQLGTSPGDYEVIIVENESPRLIAPDFLQSLPENFSYFLRTETDPTPVHAINFGARQAQGLNICIMVDGARMLTPGLVRNIVRGHKIDDNVVVTVPSYHLGYQIQQEAVKGGYGVETERNLLRGIGWPSDGYRLFEISCLSRSCEPGFFLPNSESNCISMPREIWDELGGCDSRFNMCGGGFANLDLYKRACEYPDVQHVVLPGEGSFHQYHGGVTTGGKQGKDRDALMVAIIDQYREMRGGDYASPTTLPVYIGEIPTEAQRFLQHSLDKVGATMKGLESREYVSGSALSR